MSGRFNTDHMHNVPTIGLMHFCGADANLYVNYVASIIFSDFQLSVKGQRSIASSLNNLPYVETGDDRLSFGWGPDNIIRQAVVHQYGYENLAVLVALASVFHEPYAAEVCHAYAACLGKEDDMLPHVRQWRRQLRVGCGVFTASPFAQLVEDYIRLDPYSVGPGSHLIARRCRVPPEHMANGLMELSKVTSKKQKQMTLVGGATIGWFAAFAEFFYDLNVAILSKTGQKIHGDAQSENTQVILVYHEEPDLQVLTEHWSTFTDPMADDDRFWTKHVHILPFGGRVQWQTLLPQVFGRAFWALEHNEARTLADLIGGCARGLEGDYEHHKNSGHDDFYKHSATEASYGIGLIQNLAGWLPELRKGQGRMERQLKRTFQEAANTYDEMVAHLQQLCNCTICTVTDSTRAPQYGYCLPVICETIIALGLAISRMIVAAGIYPTREGVQGVYALQAEKRMEAKFLDIKSASDRMRYFYIIYANEWRANDSRRLQNAVGLFSGNRPEKDLNDHLVAIAHEGIVAYKVELLRGDNAPPRSSERGFIQIASGAINLRQKIFTRASTEPVMDDGSYESLKWEKVGLKHLKKPLYCK